MHLGVTPWPPASHSGIGFSSDIASYFKMFTSWMPEVACHLHKGANPQWDQKPLLLLASLALPMATEPWILWTRIFSVMVRHLVHYNSLWDDEVVMCLAFPSQSIGKHFLKKFSYKSLRFLARKLGRHLEKKQHRLSPSKMCFVSCLFFFFKRQYANSLAMSLSGAKVFE